MFNISDDISREALPANVELSLCGQISYYKTTLKRIKRIALTDTELHGSMNSLPLNSSMETRIRDELDLSTRNRSRNILQFSAHDSHVRNTMNGSRSNVMISESTERLSSGLPFDIQVRNTISGSRSNILSSRDLDDIQVRNTISGSRSNILSTRDFNDGQVRNTMSSSRPDALSSRNLEISHPFHHKVDWII